MFQQEIEYNTQMTNILLKLSNLEIINKHITEEKNKFVQNMQGALEEQNLKTKLQVKQDENNVVLVKVQMIKQNINNIENHNKDLQKIKV